MARDTLAARDLRAARTACRRRSRGGAQGDGGRCLRSLQASPPKVATLRAAGRRDGPRRVDVSARPRNRSRERTPRQSRHPEVAPDVSVPRQRGIATSLQTRLASMTEAAKHHRSVSLEEPGARVKHEAPGHPSRDVFRQAVSRTASCDSTVSRTAKLLSDRLGDGHCYSTAPRDARAVVRLTAPYSPTRLDGAHEAVRVDFALYGSEDPTV